MFPGNEDYIYNKHSSYFSTLASYNVPSFISNLSTSYEKALNITNQLPTMWNWHPTMKFDLDDKDPVSDAVHGIENLISNCISYFQPQGGCTYEDENELHYDIDMPGVNKHNISVDIVGNTLTVTGARYSPYETNSDKKTVKEYKKQFILPEYANMEQIKAKSEDGVLYVTVQKKEQEKKVISIE